VGAALGVDTRRPGSAQDPARELDAVTAHIKENAAAAAVRVPEPIGMGTGMFLALLDQVHFAQSAFVDKLLGADVLRREAEFLRVHELHAGLVASGDHLFRLLQVHAQLFFANEMISYAR